MLGKINPLFMISQFARTYWPI